MELENGLIALRLLIPLEPAGPKPAVIGLPGIQTELLAAGAVSVSYRIDWDTRRDAPERMVPFPSGTGRWLLASPSGGRLGERWVRSITSMAHLGIPRIVDYLETLPGVDHERIVVAGTFTDGFVALQALAHDTRLAGALAIGACGDYHRFLQDSPLGMAGAPRVSGSTPLEYARSVDVGRAETVEIARLVTRAVYSPRGVDVTAADRSELLRSEVDAACRARMSLTTRLLDHLDPRSAWGRITG